MRLKKLAVLIAAAGISMPAFATNGYFAHGIGVKSKAMGGAGIAYSEDGLGIAANPATLTQAQQGFTLGASIFAPDRSSSLRGGTNGVGGNIPGGAGEQSANHKGPFLIPEFAYARHGTNGFSYGVAVYGNGGMNVDYGKAIYDTTGDKTFTNLEQLFIAPTIAFKVNEQHTVAASLNVVYQTFQAGGLDMFTQYTRGAAFTTPACNLGGANPCGYTGGGVDPGDQGKDSSSGLGLRLGWTGKLMPNLTVGAFYQPKTSMSKFDKYRNLFAEDGGFDIPATYGLGIAFAATAATTVLFDVVQIDYSKIKSLANKNNHYPPGTQLGSADGKGFGWSDMTVFKLGLRHQLNDKTTIRAGWNYGKQPIGQDQLDFNLLAPAVVEQHLTLGMTYKLDANSEVSAHYMHAFKKQVTGPMANGTGTIHVNALQMSQDEVGVQYSWRF